MSKYIYEVSILIILVSFVLIKDYFATKKLKKKLLKERDKAYIYRDLVILNNTYYKFLVEKKLDKYPLIKNYLESSTAMLEECGMDLNLNLFIEEGVKFKVKLNTNELEKFDEFMNQLEKCPEPIRKAVYKNAKIFQRIIKFQHPQLYRCIELEAKKELFKIIFDILTKLFKNTANGMLEKIYVIFIFNKKIYGDKCEKLLSI